MNSGINWKDRFEPINERQKILIAKMNERLDRVGDLKEELESKRRHQRSSRSLSERSRRLSMSELRS